MKEKGEEKGGEKGVDIIELKEDDDILIGFKGTIEVCQKKRRKRRNNRKKRAKEEKVEKEDKVENKEDKNESLDNLGIDEEISLLFKLLPDNYRNKNLKNLFYSNSNNLKIQRRNNEHLKKIYKSQNLEKKRKSRNRI